MTATELLTDVAVIVAGYLLGAVPVGLLVARWQRGIDLRRYGSGSTGATNVLRALGWRASLVVLIGDCVKTIIPVYLAGQLTGNAWVESTTAVVAIAGHCWSPYSGWRGGRGSSSSFAALLVLQPPVAIASFVVAGVTVALTRYMSVASILGTAFGGLVMAWLVLHGSVPLGDIVFTIGSPAIVFIRHRENVVRLLAGTERKFGLKSDTAPGKAPT
jgi:glycerol-3-phosphate acyltransferase PlsY